MARNCGIAIALWIALAGGYFWFLRTRLEMPVSLIVALVIATIVWVALVNMHAARLAYADWQARNRMARGERPHDGDLVSAVGELRPTFEPLRSPLRGTPCVAYTYKIGPRGEMSEGSTPDYAGFAATRCAVQTPYGSFQLGSFPLFEDNVAR